MVRRYRLRILSIVIFSLIFCSSCAPWYSFRNVRYDTKEEALKAQKVYLSEIQKKFSPISTPKYGSALVVIPTQNAYATRGVIGAYPRPLPKDYIDYLVKVSATHGQFMAQFLKNWNFFESIEIKEALYPEALAYEKRNSYDAVIYTKLPGYGEIGLYLVTPHSTEETLLFTKNSIPEHEWGYSFFLNNIKRTMKKEKARFTHEKVPVVKAGSKPGQVWKAPDSVTGMEFVWVPKGCFQMGSSSGESDEEPVHEVCVDGFWIGKYEVTQGQWKRVMGNNPSHFKKGNDYPVEKVSWDYAKEFIRKLNSLDNGQFKFRLPTEAEWEYACRSGGKPEKYAGGNDVGRVAWYDSNGGRSTHPVGIKVPNGLGIYDMSGNVWEWCEDTYIEEAYNKHQHNNPIYTGSGFLRVFRGGSWSSERWYVRCALRGRGSPEAWRNDIGFRLVRKQRESQRQKLEVASLPQKPSYTRPSSTSDAIEHDVVYVAYANGIVRDTKTGLEWKVGPDIGTNWNQAKSWVQNLNLDGGGWRMPTMLELKGLYKKGAGERNMIPLLKTTGWRVWSGEPVDSSKAWTFHFYSGTRFWDPTDTSFDLRGFAVRSRSDG